MHSVANAGSVLHCRHPTSAGVRKRGERRVRRAAPQHPEPGRQVRYGPKPDIHCAPHESPHRAESEAVIHHSHAGMTNTARQLGLEAVIRVFRKTWVYRNDGVELSSRAKQSHSYS